MNNQRQTRLEVACMAARAAGALQREALGQKRVIETKSSAIDLVTDTDKACDALICEMLSKEFPDDLLLTEETYQEGDNIDLSATWVVDPIDGTTNFAHGFPHFAVSIAFVESGEPTVGVIYHTMMDELFVATKGSGAYLNGEPIQASGCHDLSTALMATGFAYDRKTDENANIRYYDAVMRQCHGVRRAGAAALDLAYVAAGRLDGFWEFKLSPWDVAAGVLLVQEADGVCEAIGGENVCLSERKMHIIAAASQGLVSDVQNIFR